VNGIKALAAMAENLGNSVGTMAANATAHTGRPAATQWQQRALPAHFLHFCAAITAPDDAVPPATVPDARLQSAATATRAQS
jgi:hypothetical protein